MFKQLSLDSLISVGQDEPVMAAVLKEIGSSRLCLVYFDIEYARYVGAGMVRQHTDKNTPMAHGAMIDILNAIGWRIEKVVILGVTDNVFINEIHLHNGEQSAVRKISTADCLAFAGYVRCPIFIDDATLSRIDSHLDDDLRRQILALPSVKTTGRTTAAAVEACSLPQNKLPQA